MVTKLRPRIQNIVNSVIDEFDFQNFIKSELQARESEPRDDLLTHLVQARDEQDQHLTMGEMLAVTRKFWWQVMK